MILLCIQAKLQLFQNHRALLLCASKGEIFLAVVQLKKSLVFRLCNFTMLQKQKKPSLKQIEHKKLDSVTKMAAKIDIDPPKI